MMERRILKDFQIGIVETIVSEAVKNTAGADVFSSIAKAMKTRRSTHKRFVTITMLNVVITLKKFFFDI